MSGGLLYTFREGNRSELLADFLLSAIGVTIPVRRQDDYGIDFHCQIADQEKGYLTFGYPFIIQIKSNNHPLIFGEVEPSKWKQEHISWLFKQEIPFLLGIVNKKDFSISIYETSKKWFIHYMNPNCTQIEFIPESNPNNGDTSHYKLIPLDNWPEDKGDKAKYQIYLGPPIATISKTELESEGLINKIKTRLRHVIQLEQENITDRNLGLKHFKWIINSDDPMNIGLMHYSIGIDLTDQIYQSLSTGLISLAMNLCMLKRYDEYHNLKPILKKLQKLEVYSQMKTQFPEAFDWLE